MAQVSEAFADKVNTYKGGGYRIASADAGPFSRSAERQEEGLRRSDQVIKRFARERSADSERGAKEKQIAKQRSGVSDPERILYG